MSLPNFALIGQSRLRQTARLTPNGDGSPDGPCSGSRASPEVSRLIYFCHARQSTFAYGSCQQATLLRVLTPACLAPKCLPVPVRGVVARLEELRTERGVNRKQIAGVLRKTRQAVDASLSGRTNMTVADAERVAASLGASLEVVVRADPSDAFRRALEAQKDIPPVLRDAIWTLFEQATLQRMRAVRPKKEGAGSSRSSRGRPA